MDQEPRFIGNPSNSDCLKEKILTTLEGQTSSFILVVGPRRVGKDYLLKHLKENDLLLPGEFIYSQNDLNLISEELQPTLSLMNMGELNFYGFDATDERSSATSRIRAQAYNNIINFSKENNVPIVANLSISKHTANPWDIRGIEEGWRSFLTDVLQLSLPDKAIIYYLNMDVQLCALKLWNFRGNPDTFDCYGGQMMCIPNFEQSLWLQKSEADFFGDLGRIFRFPLKSNAQIMMEHAAKERGEMSS